MPPQQLKPFSPDEVDLYLTALRDEPTPFDIFVSRAGKAAVKDKIDVPRPRSRATRAVRRALSSVMQDSVTRFVPINGPAGSGKTHFYWFLKEQEEEQVISRWAVVYIPSPPSSIRIPLHLYTCIIDELGDDLLISAGQNLVKHFSPAEIPNPSVREIVTSCIREYPGLSADVIKSLVLLVRGEKEERDLAERWLLADHLSEEEMDSLGVNHILEDDDLVTSSIRILLENYDKTVVLYFDELEIPYRTLGKTTAAAFIEHLKRIYNEIRNVLLITACLTDIWPQILGSLDEAMQQRLEREAQLLPFSLQDVEAFYINAMNLWWSESQNIEPPSNQLFPLSHGQFEDILAESRGNPRNTIKAIRNKLDDVIEDRLMDTDDFSLGSLDSGKLSDVGEPTGISDSDMAVLDEGGEAGEVPTTEPTPNASAVPTSAPPAKRPRRLTEPEHEILENVTIEVNPSSLIAGVLNTFRIFYPDALYEENFEFEHKGKARSLALRITIGERRIGFEVPSVKSFDRRGGVAAYYALTRVIEALNSEVDRAVLIVPEGTSGKKYQRSLSQVEELVTILELDENQAEDLIRGGLIKEPSAKGVEMKDSIEEFLKT